MKRERPQRALDYAPIAIPAVTLFVFFVIPFGTMIAVSLFTRDPAAFYSPELTLANYQRFLSAFFGKVLGFSLMISALAALISVGIAFPFTWGLCRLSRRAQAGWLVAILSTLSLSEVIIGFAWSTLFSRNAGISNLAVWLGLLEAPVALSPSFGAVLTAMVYQALPYAVLVLYPSLARLDPALGEAARTMGASPVRAFLTVVAPVCRSTLAAAVIMVFVFALGAYLLPQILGKPSHWTLSVLITDQAIYQSNMPFAAAMAVFLVVISLSLVAITALLGRKEAA